jgi:hypothetical protein
MDKTRYNLINTSYSFIKFILLPILQVYNVAQTNVNTLMKMAGKINIYLSNEEMIQVINNSNSKVRHIYT